MILFAKGIVEYLCQIDEDYILNFSYIDKVCTEILKHGGFYCDEEKTHIFRISELKTNKHNPDVLNEWNLVNGKLYYEIIDAIYPDEEEKEKDTNELLIKNHILLSKLKISRDKKNRSVKGNSELRPLLIQNSSFQEKMNDPNVYICLNKDIRYSIVKLHISLRQYLKGECDEFNLYTRGNGDKIGELIGFISNWEGQNIDEYTNFSDIIFSKIKFVNYVTNNLLVKEIAYNLHLTISSMEQIKPPDNNSPNKLIFLTYQPYTDELKIYKSFKKIKKYAYEEGFGFEYVNESIVDYEEYVFHDKSIDVDIVYTTKIVPKIINKLYILREIIDEKRYSLLIFPSIKLILDNLRRYKLSETHITNLEKDKNLSININTVSHQYKIVELKV